VANHDLDPDISAKEAGRRGGLATLNKKGRKFYQEIGKKGGLRTAELYKEVLSDFGKAGGRPKSPSI